MAKKVRLHHPQLRRTVTVPSERVARVMRPKGWKDGGLPAAAPVKATASKKENVNG